MEGMSTFEMITGIKPVADENPAVEEGKEIPADTAETVATEAAVQEAEEKAPGVTVAEAAAEEETTEGTEEKTECEDATEIPAEAEEQEPMVSAKDVMEELDSLKAMFQQKLMVDAQKRELIERLTSEVDGYREEFFKKMFIPFIKEIIVVANDLQRMARTYREKPDEMVTKEKLVSLLEDYQSDLEDVLHNHAVDVLCEEGDDFNARTQKSIKVIETGDESKHKKIAQRLVHGFTMDGKLLETEKVMVYKYNPALAATESPAEEEAPAAASEGAAAAAETDTTMVSGTSAAE